MFAVRQALRSSRTIASRTIPTAFRLSIPSGVRASRAFSTSSHRESNEAPWAIVSAAVFGSLMAYVVTMDVGHHEEHAIHSKSSDDDVPADKKESSNESTSDSKEENDADSDNSESKEQESGKKEEKKDVKKGEEKNEEKGEKKEEEKDEKDEKEEKEEK